MVYVFEFVVRTCRGSRVVDIMEHVYHVLLCFAEHGLICASDEGYSYGLSGLVCFLRELRVCGIGLLFVRKLTFFAS